jgi:diphosphomevalonate decarboxylase
MYVIKLFKNKIHNNKYYMNKDIPEKILKINKKIQSHLSKDICHGFASAPSNIALIKYWGKIPNRLQQPENSSISLTLGDLRTETSITLKKDSKKTITINNKNFSPKIQNYIQHISFLEDFSFEITTNNNFPTACGFASSASGFAALSGSIASALDLKNIIDFDDMNYWITQYARIGSGSAIRSALFDCNTPFIIWQKPSQSLNEFSEVFNLQNYDSKWNEIGTISLVFDSEKKKVSSSDGHSDAPSSPLYNIRKISSEKSIELLLLALQNYDWDLFSYIVEADSYMLHAIMQTSKNPTVYIDHNISTILQSINTLKKKLSFPFCWTMDAGKNIHIITMKNNILQFETEIKKIIETLDTIKLLNSIINTSHKNLIF